MIIPLEVKGDAIVEGGHSFKAGINVINNIGHIDKTVLMHCNAINLHIGFGDQGRKTISWCHDLCGEGIQQSSMTVNVVDKSLQGNILMGLSLVKMVKQTSHQCDVVCCVCSRIWVEMCHLGSNAHDSQFEAHQPGNNATSCREFVPHHTFQGLGVKLGSLKTLDIPVKVLAPACKSVEVTVGNGHRIDKSIRDPVRQIGPEGSADGGQVIGRSQIR